MSDATRRIGIYCLMVGGFAIFVAFALALFGYPDVWYIQNGSTLADYQELVRRTTLLTIPGLMFILIGLPMLSPAEARQ